MKKIALIIALTLMGALANAQILLTPENTVVLRGEIDDSSAAKATTELLALEAKRGKELTPIYLVLDTPGGSVDAGELLIEAAKTIKNLQTITIFAASMGSAIVEAIPNQRLILSSGVLMFHRATVGLQGQVEDGELESRLSMVKTAIRRLEQRNADRMSMTLEAYKAVVKDEYWLVGADAVRKMAADQIVTIKCSQELIKKSSVQQIQILIFTIDVSFSGCPLLREGSVVDKEQESLYNIYKEQNKSTKREFNYVSKTN